MGSAVPLFNRYALKPLFERTRNTSLVFLSELGANKRRLSDFSWSEKSWECPSCSVCWYWAHSPRTSWILKAAYIARAYPVPDPTNRNSPRGCARKCRAHSAARLSIIDSESSFGNRRIMEATARREAEKLAVPDVRIPELLYGNRITSSHSFASWLLGFAVIATRFLASPLTLLESCMFVLVLPLTDVMKTVLFLDTSG